MLEALFGNECPSIGKLFAKLCFSHTWNIIATILKINYVLTYYDVNSKKEKGKFHCNICNMSLPFKTNN